MDQLRLRGLDASRVIGVHLDTAAYDGKIQINADLASSHLVAYYHTVYNVAEMKKIGGVPDSMVRAREIDAIIYPEEPRFDLDKLVNRYNNPRSLGLLLGREGTAMVKQAAVAYLSGDSQRVIDLGYEPIINALFFPMVVTSVAADTITVQNGQTCQLGATGDPPQNLTVSDVTMYGTGSLQYLSDYTLNCTGSMVQAPA